MVIVSSCLLRDVVMGCLLTVSARKLITGVLRLTKTKVAITISIIAVMLVVGTIASTVYLFVLSYNKIIVYSI